MKRSNSPIFWLLFGAGGMLAALFGTALVYITGIAVPLNFTLSSDLMNYTRVHAFAQNWIGKGFLFAIIALFAWHAVHRILCSLHDVGIHKTSGADPGALGREMVIDTLAALACHGFLGNAHSNVSTTISLLKVWPAGSCILGGKPIYLERLAYLYTMPAP